MATEKTALLFLTRKCIPLEIDITTCDTTLATRKVEGMDLTIFRKSIQLLANADNIDIIGHIKRDVTATLSAIDRESTKLSLGVNERKTKYMLSKDTF